MPKQIRPKRTRTSKKISRALPVIHPDAAGVDISATELWVAVPADRDEVSVRCFDAFAEDLLGLPEWLRRSGITSVAMESTGVYWIPLFLLLEERGFEVRLVNARHVKNVLAEPKAKNVPGRKTDVLDCQWLQYLHSVGLLRGSFHPSEEVSATASRSYKWPQVTCSTCRRRLRR